MRQITYTVLIEQDESGAYIAKVPNLKGCHSYAHTIPELLKRIREAIELCREVEGKKSRPDRFVGIQQVSIPA